MTCIACAYNAYLAAFGQYFIGCSVNNSNILLNRKRTAAMRLQSCCSHVHSTMPKQLVSAYYSSPSSTSSFDVHECNHLCDPMFLR